MFQHFSQRLKRDLKQIVDRRLETTAATSGSQVKVRLLLCPMFHISVDHVSVLWC
jgi:hypothetical protein